MMKNKEHFIPAPIRDIEEQLSQQNINRNVKETLLGRLETVRDYCDYLLTLHKRNGIVQEAEAFKRRSKN